MCIIEAVGVAEVTENSVSQPSTQHIHCFGKHTLLSKKKKKNPTEKQADGVLWVMDEAKNHPIMCLHNQIVPSFTCKHLYLKK